MTELVYFDFNSNSIRVVEIDGEPWFVAADVCGVLSLTNPSMAIKALDDDEVTLSQIEGSHRKTNIINESGLFALILRSDKPEAKPFRKWVTSDVLPTIRKTGGYGNVVAFDPEDPAQLRGLLVNYAERTQVAEARVIELEPKAEAFDLIDASEGSVTPRVAAKTLDVPERKFTKWLEVNGWAFRQSGRGKLQAYAERRKQGYG